MATLALAADLDQIADDEDLVTYDGALGNIRVVLPSVVSGGGDVGDNIVDFGHDIQFQNNGTARLEIQEYHTGVRVAIMEPFSSLVLRSIGNLDGEPAWVRSSQEKEIIAVSEATHIVDLTSTAVTSDAAALALGPGDTYAAATINSALNTDINTVGASFETDVAVAFAEHETTLNLVLAALRTAGIIAAS